MAQLRWNTIVPLGTLVVAAPGSTVSLAANCGPLQGQVGGNNYMNPPVSGTPLRQLVLTNVTGNAIAYLLPRGYNAATNAGLIIAAIMGGQTIALPYGTPFENGILPENFVIDGSAAATVIGYGIIS